MRRELDEIEYFSWCFGQPYNMVVVVRFRGELAPERLRRALDLAQRRHPLLAVNTEVDPGGVPWFDSEGVGRIPLAVVEGTGADPVPVLVERELSAVFVRDASGPDRPPLLRVTLLRPCDPTRASDVVFTVQHVIADGLSMVFLVRDLLGFMENPAAPVVVLDAAASADELLPPEVRRRVARSPLRLRIALWIAESYVWLRFGGRREPPRQRTKHHRDWVLTREQTTSLRARCRREGVSVQAALCAAFLPEFPAIHTPVDLRSRLARPVGESVGLFVGAAEVALRYRARAGLWANARRFRRRLHRALRDPFRIFRLVSKAVPADLIRRLGPLAAKITSGTRPFAVTNLGELDGKVVSLAGETLAIESFFGAVTGVLDASAVTVYTIDGRLRLHLMANEIDTAPTSIRDDAERAVQRLLAAIDG